MFPLYGARVSSSEFLIFMLNCWQARLPFASSMEMLNRKWERMWQEYSLVEIVVFVRQNYHEIRTKCRLIGFQFDFHSFDHVLFIQSFGLVPFSIININFTSHFFVFRINKLCSALLLLLSTSFFFSLHSCEKE